MFAVQKAIDENGGNAASISPAHIASFTGVIRSFINREIYKTVLQFFLNSLFIQNSMKTPGTVSIF